VFQRYDLQSGTGRNKATVFRDCDGIFVNGVPIPTDPTCFLSDNGDPIPFGDLVVVPLRGENPLKKEARVIAIDAGAKGQMDNIHQTFNNRVEPPGGRFPGGAFPGCPECTHLHWRWSSALGPQFNNGAPLIPDGSTQTVELQMRSRNKAVPLKELDELRKPVSDNPARNSTLTNPITWLIASSDRPADQFFDYPVFLFPEADLSLKLTRVGTELPTNATSRTTYTATIHNAGPASVTPDVELSAHVTVEQNSGALNVAATPDRGACIVAPQILGGFDMRCNLDSVSVTQESTVTIVVEAARPARIRIDGSVEGRRPDFTVPKNNVVRPLRTVIK
jgi:hypothetical protein